MVFLLLNLSSISNKMVKRMELDSNNQQHLNKIFGLSMKTLSSELRGHQLFLEKNLRAPVNFSPALHPLECGIWIKLKKIHSLHNEPAYRLNPFDCETHFLVRSTSLGSMFRPNSGNFCPVFEAGPKKMTNCRFAVGGDDNEATYDRPISVPLFVNFSF